MVDELTGEKEKAATDQRPITREASAATGRPYHSKQYEHYLQPVVRCLNAAGRLAVALLHFFDSHAAPVIALFTVVLACVSVSQWKVTQRQMTDFEEAEAAAVSIEHFSAAGFPHARISFELVNSGHSQADRIQLLVSGHGGAPKPLLGPGTHTGVGFPPSEMGFSLAAGEKRRFSGTSNFFPPLPKGYPKGLPTAQGVIMGKMGFYITVAIAYRDVFGHVHSSEDCLAYERAGAVFIPCPLGGHFMQ